MKLAESFKRLGQAERADRVEKCGKFLELANAANGSMRIKRANFCRERLCPGCQRRRSVRIFASASEILDYIEQRDDRARILFVTLTFVKCQPDQLGEVMDEIASGFNRLVSNSAWTSRMKGCMRALEVTVNHDTGTFHPHCHLILAVDKDYLRKGNKSYWTEEKWAKVWQKSARLEYEPHVLLKTIKGSRQGIEWVSKYMEKDCDYILPKDPETADRMVSILMKHMGGRRLVSYTGCMLEAKRALNLTELVSAPLPDSIRGDIAVAIRRYHFNSGICRYSERKGAHEPGHEELVEPVPIG